jgi:ribose transport system ATP-binding protein
VIIGGGYFSGGVVTHVGAVLGSVILTLVSILLGLFRVSTDYTATIQGFVLITILSLRLFQKEKTQ